MIKKKFPEKVIILGGIAPTESAEEIMHKFPFINFIIKGCGVETLPKLIIKLKNKETNFSDVSGLVYRDQRDLHINPDYRFYSNSVLENAITYNYKEARYLYNFDIITSFGCPYRCTYCQVPSLYPGKIIYRDLDKVIEEIKFIKRIKRNREFRLNILDEGFIINRKRMIEFFNLLRANKLNVEWACYGRVDRMDEELLKIMSKNGCKYIFYGVESGSNRILKKIKKGFTVEKAIKILLLTKKYIKTVHASFIFLYPFEKIRDFKLTIAMKKYLNLQGISVALSPLVPIKNSEIYFRYKKNLVYYETMGSTFRNRIMDIPKACARLIRNYPDIFYLYYTYNFSEFIKILKLNYDDSKKEVASTNF